MGRGGGGGGGGGGKEGCRRAEGQSDRRQKFSEIGVNSVLDLCTLLIFVYIIIFWQILKEPEYFLCICNATYNFIMEAKKIGGAKSHQKICF